MTTHASAPRPDFSAALVQRLADLGLGGECIPTGGGCEAVQVSYGKAGELLITDGDAALPSFEYGVLVLDYPAELDGEGVVVADLPAGTSVNDAAARVYDYMHTGK